MTPAPVWVLTGGLYFSTLATQPEAIGHEDEDRWLGLHPGAGVGAGHGGPSELILDVGALTGREALPGQLFVHAGREDGLLGLLVDQPHRRLMRGLDDMGVCDDPSVGVDEPARARLAEGVARDRPRARAAVEATSVATSETTSTVAGLARRTISCSDIVSAAQAFGGAWAASVRASPARAKPGPGRHASPLTVSRS